MQSLEGDVGSMEKNSLLYVERDEQHHAHMNLYVGSEIRYTPTQSST
jgi:hypothetical protein